MTSLNVLVGCEYSGVVREAFRKLGHNAWSCDLLEGEGNTTYHLKGDLKVFLEEGCDGTPKEWDLMIFHPPCTHLAVSGARWFKDKQKEQQEALEFVRLLLNVSCKHVALENPVSIISSHIRKPDQIVQPWMFGDPHEKKTCLWLKNLPPLEPTNIVEPEARVVLSSGKTLPAWYNLPPSEDRGKIRSKTFQGFADAMASQWSEYIMNSRKTMDELRSSE